MHRKCSVRDFDVVEGRILEKKFVLQYYPELEHDTNVRIFASSFSLVLRGGLEDRKLHREMQTLARKYLKNYLKCRAKKEKKVLAILMAVNINLALFAVRFLKKTV